MDCKIFDCREKLDTVYNNIVTSTDKPVCVESYPSAFYSTGDTYCTDVFIAEDKTTIDSVIYCGEEDVTEKDILCTNETSCCVNNCILAKTGDFTAFCGSDQF